MYKDIEDVLKGLKQLSMDLNDSNHIGSNIEILKLGHNIITDNAVPYICDLIHGLKKLKVLNISHNKITTNGFMKILNKSIEIGSLTMLVVYPNRIKENCLKLIEEKYDKNISEDFIYWSLRHIFPKDLAKMIFPIKKPIEIKLWKHKTIFINSYGIHKFNEFIII